MTVSTPVFFAPIFKEKVWGGRNLYSRLAKQVSPEKKIGESWELSAYPPDISRVESGPLTGTSLREIVASDRTAVMGAASGAGDFPLLYKFIDAQDRLSIQVHPDDAQARANGWGAYGKTECWYIIAAEPGARVICGFKRAVDGKEVRERVRDGTLNEVLNTFSIRAGDLVFVPAGTVHANQPGTFLYEVQQSSDTTLRLFDWDRNDPGRPLHIDESLLVLDMSAHNRHCIPAVVLDSRQGIERKLRIACRYFAIEELRFIRSAEMPLDPKGSFRVITVLDGSIDVSHDAGRDRIGKGRTVLLPACLRTSVAAGDAGSHFLISWVPHLAHEIVDPLRRQGTPDSDIELLGGNALRNDLLPLLAG